MSDNTYPQGFKGVWIPLNIWDMDELDIWDKHVLSEINFLDNHNDGGDYCFASNQYLSQLLKCSERTISRSISHLKDLGLVSVVKTDGRRRWIESRVDKCASQSRQIGEADSHDWRDNNIPIKKEEKYKSFDRVLQNEERGGERDDFSYFILYQQIDRACMSIDCDEFYRDVSDIFEYFYEVRKRFLNYPYPKYKDRTIKEVVNAIVENITETDSSVDEYKQYILNYFNTKFKGNDQGKCDYSIRHFVTVLKIRDFEREKRHYVTDFNDPDFGREVYETEFE